MHEELKIRLSTAVDAILNSPAPKKLVVAGPGAGKTFLFKRLLERLDASQEDALVLTFINNLKDDLERDLGTISQVYTFHGYCRRLLHERSEIREPLTKNFHYFPSLPSLIAGDWKIARDENIPKFVGLMRDIQHGQEIDFYIARANYYDAASFDDSVFRAYTALRAQAEEVSSYGLLLVDEYQDFNRLEVEFLQLLGTVSPIVVAGDDDQALYSQLRSSSPTYIRNLYAGGEYETFSLPFCMRCTAPIVGAVDDVIRRARQMGWLGNRIEKPYEFFPPKKEGDTARYPKIKIIKTTVQRERGANYFGRYIQEQVALIPAEEVQEAEQGNFPAVLVIGPKQYLRQVKQHLEGVGYLCEGADGDDFVDLAREDGLRILKANTSDNLGWRILLEIDQPVFAVNVLRQSVVDEHPLIDLLEAETDYRDNVLAEAAAFTEEEQLVEVVPMEEQGLSPKIRLVSYEGSKGLSAQHVFIIGLHNGDLPSDPTSPTDLEICKFLVALTRTRKQCHLLHTQRWGAVVKQRSAFLDWINTDWISHVFIDKNYWQ